MSEMTVRRDLRVLQEQGLVEHVLGGGQVAGSAHEPAFMAKRVIQQWEKTCIAKAALRLIDPGMTIGFTAGTTTWTLAQHIRGFSDLTFITNSTNIALDLNGNGWMDIILTGGNFRTPSDAMVGPLAEATVKKLHMDVLFLGLHGADVEFGLSTPNILEASINRAMMEQAEKVVAVFDHTKWGVQALAHIADFDEIDVLITDDAAGQAEIEQVQNLGVTIMMAPFEGESL